MAMTAAEKKRRQRARRTPEQREAAKARKRERKRKARAKAKAATARTGQPSNWQSHGTIRREWKWCRKAGRTGARAVGGG